MSTQQPSRPVITQAMREQAVKQPNTWLYVVDPIFTDPNVEVPPWGFIGGYRVDENGALTDDFSPNPHYRPSPVALRLPAPANDLERALQLTTTGYAQGQMLLNALLDAELILFSQPQGNGLFTVEHDSGRRQLQVFTSDTYLPQQWTSWQRMTGRQLATHPLAGVDVQLNPASPVKARIPGEDLLKAAGTQQQQQARPTVALETATVAAPSAPASAPSAPSAAPEHSTVALSRPAVTSTQQVPTVAKTNGTQVLPVDATQPVPQGQKRSAAWDNDFGKRFLGSMLAGAIGDALGSAVEFYPIDQIRSRFGEQGVADYDRTSERPGEFTDDTQMALFTLEGLIRGHIARRAGTTDTPLPAIQLAYQRWLHTQGYAWTRAAGPFAEQHPEPTGWLVKQRDLFAVRSPNSACITALREFASVGAPGTFERAINDSADCGGVVRAAPLALWSEDPREVFELAAASAALTYSHPNGYLPAGVFAALLHGLLRGAELSDALDQARALLTEYAGHEATNDALGRAVELAKAGKPTPEQLKDALGGGWVGHEALALAVCAAMSTDSIASGVMVAVNHSGDSDSTGAICGNIVGAQYAAAAVPGVWLRDLKQREIVETLVADALAEFGQQPPDDEQWAQRYPAATDTSELVFTSTLPRVGESEQAQAEPEQPVAVEESDQPAAADVAEQSDGDVPERPAPPEQPEVPAEAEPEQPVSADVPAQPAGDEQPSPSRAEAVAPEPEGSPDRRGRFLGCLLGGAVGDALGCPIEDFSLDEIRGAHGADGLTDFVDSDRPRGSISDDTQLTLFTVDGLVRAGIRRRLGGPVEPAAQVQHAYQRWLHTQGFDWDNAAGPGAAAEPDGWLIQCPGLFVRRAPEETSVRALHGYAGGQQVGSFAHRVNDANGYGGVMRAAPAALWSDDPAQVFRIGALTAVLTHGHPSGFLPAGVLAVVVQQLLDGQPLTRAIERAFIELTEWDGHEETATALRHAIDLAAEGVPTPELVQERLGSGLTGAEALSIAICAALSHPGSFGDAVLLAANHSGNSGSTAAICGNIMGAAHALDGVPQRWRDQLELRPVLVELAEDAVREFSAQPPSEPDWFQRYPIEPAVAPVQATAGQEPGGAAQTDRAEKAEAVSESAAPARPAAPPAVEQEPVVAAPQSVPEEVPAPASETEQPEAAASTTTASATTATDTAERSAPSEAPAEESDDDPLSDEELRLLSAWRKFRDGDDDTPTDLSHGLHKLLAEAFGEERAAQLIGEDTETEQAEPPEQTQVQLDRDQRFAGCVLGGAAGDALGAPWMFSPLETIRQQNPDGLREFTEFFGRRGAATSLSQQAVFVLDGLIRAALCARLRGVDANTYPPGMVRLTLQHWAWAQGARFEPSLALGELANAPELRAQRFPDEASMTALTRKDDTGQTPTASHPPNAARTPTAAARAAVVGFHAPTPEAAVALGAEVAVATHGHPDGYLPAGAAAGMVAAIANGATVAESVRAVLGELDVLEGSEPTVCGLRAALEIAGRPQVTPEVLAELGTGWTGPEALAIAVCAALASPNDVATAVSLAATHSGNSAATAMLCGSLLGAANGVDAVPTAWREELELRELLDRLSTDEARIEAEVRSGEPAPEWAARYAG